MANKINKGKASNKHSAEKPEQVQMNIYVPKTLKEKLVVLHKDFMKVFKLEITFKAFVQHLIEEGIKAKDGK